MKVLEISNINLEGLCYLSSERYPFLLESVSNNQNNRYSILFAHPSEKIVLNDLEDFDFLDKLVEKVKKPNIKSDLPFTGGWFVYLSYEMVGQIEPILKPDLPSNKQALAIAVKVPTAIIFDCLDNKTYLLDQFDNQQRINQTLTDITRLQDVPTALIKGQLSCEPPSKFINGVKRAQDYIIAGDVFQVNLSRQWQYQLNNDISPAQLYQSLKKANPAPFSALADFGDFSVISSSPERLFSVHDRCIQTRPIAGTHPRGTGKEDEQLKQQLISHPKEQAEHIMLIDLERNDLGRVCEHGSIKVDKLMLLETYPFVHHIVSNIQGTLKRNTTIKDIFRALFPGGTITGCPKVRCMQIISELEQMPRQAYTGSLGYISSNGNMDFNILIRTLGKQNNTLTFRAGAGIVFDSIIQRELEETQHKAKGLLKIFN